MGLSAGTLDRDIVLQTGTTQQSPSGDPVMVWGGDVVLQAEWLPAGTREAWNAQQRLGSYVDGVFKIYDITPRQTPNASRILFDGRVFDVKPYVELGRHEGLLIPVTAKGEGGP